MRSKIENSHRKPWTWKRSSTSLLIAHGPFTIYVAQSSVLWRQATNSVAILSSRSVIIRRISYILIFCCMHTYPSTSNCIHRVDPLHFYVFLYCYIHYLAIVMPIHFNTNSSRWASRNTLVVEEGLAMEVNGSQKMLNIRQCYIPTNYSLLTCQSCCIVKELHDFTRTTFLTLTKPTDLRNSHDDSP